MNDQKNEKKCLECQAQIILEPNTQVGEVITCPDCSTGLEVIQIKPLKLSLARVVQEDWGQ